MAQAHSNPGSLLLLRLPEPHPWSALCTPFFSLKYHTPSWPSQTPLSGSPYLSAHALHLAPGAVSELRRPSFPSTASNSEGLASFHPFYRRGNRGSERPDAAPGRRSWNPLKLCLLYFALMSSLSWKIRSELWFPNFGFMSMTRGTVMVQWQSCRSRHSGVGSQHASVYGLPRALGDYGWSGHTEKQ